MNRVTEGPQLVRVPVENGQVTPVHVTLTPVGEAAVETKNYEYRPTARASRRVTRHGTEASVAYKVGALAETPLEYQPKEQMPYCR